MRNVLLILGVLSLVSRCPARDVAPADPPSRQTLGQVIDPRQPAPINSPKFLSQRSEPAGLAERKYAVQFTVPGVGFYGFGYIPWSFYGYGFDYGYSGGWGGNWSGASYESGDSLP